MKLKVTPDEVEEESTTNVDGKVILAKLYNFGTVLTIQVAKDGYEAKSPEDIWVTDNDGKANVVEMVLNYGNNHNQFSAPAAASFYFFITLDSLC